MVLNWKATTKISNWVLAAAFAFATAPRFTLGMSFATKEHFVVEFIRHVCEKGESSRSFAK